MIRQFSKDMTCAQPNNSCGSELARDVLKGAAFIQKKRDIVDVHREQARSYRVCVYQSNTPKVM